MYKLEMSIWFTVHWILETQSISNAKLSHVAGVTN